jgi:NAD-dependent deacetylase sirtuin 4
MLSDGELQERIQAVINWLSTKESVLVLTGAGISTESGVPDYRGHNGSYHDGHQPMLHQQFMTSSTHRQRYWARGMVGWRSFSSRRPNAGHVALAELEKRGVVGVSFHDSADFYDEKDPTAVDARDRGPEKLRSLTVVTQNVDSLHQRSGSRQVLDLHGRGDMVRCMSCGATSPRSDYHDRLERENADWLAKAFEHLSTQSTAMRPDGDAVLSSVSDYSNLRVPNCESCGVGFVKPDVVFFGDSVPRNRVELCNAAVSASDGILVVGTSLAVHSAYRHVRAATQRGTPVCILNVGETRAEIDGLPGIIKVEAPVGATLSGVAAHYNFS